MPPSGRASIGRSRTPFHDTHSPEIRMIVNAVVRIVVASALLASSFALRASTFALRASADRSAGGTHTGSHLRCVAGAVQGMARLRGATAAERRSGLLRRDQCTPTGRTQAVAGPASGDRHHRLVDSRAGRSPRGPRRNERYGVPPARPPAVRARSGVLRIDHQRRKRHAFEGRAGDSRRDQAVRLSDLAAHPAR